MRVLVVEDDRCLGGFLKQGLELEGHSVAWAEDGEAALACVEMDHPDLVLLDLSLPKRDGMDVLTEIRTWHEDAVVLVLTGRGDVDVRVQCLDMGADDYLLKPFSFFELTARCRALLRRHRQFADPVLRHGDLELHRIEHKVLRAGRPICLTAKEFSLLEYLLLHQGECVSRSELLEKVWGTPDQTGTNVVDVYVNYLRRKIGDSEAAYAHASGGGLIETVRGVGYRLGGFARSSMERDSEHSAPVAGAVCA